MLIKNGETKACLLTTAVLLLALPLHADPYQKLSEDILLVARKTGTKRIAVLPLRPIGGSGKSGGLVISERIVSRLAGGRGVEIVERTLLDRVLREQKLGYDGVLDPRQAKQVGRILGVQALMTGTFVPLGNGRIEVHTRLIDSETARILGVSFAKVRKEWEDNSFLVSAPFDPFEEDPETIAPPEVRGTPDPFRGRMDMTSGSGGCLNWENRLDRMQAPLIETKARYWATRLRSKDFSPASLTRNPGSEIRSNEARHRFYKRVKELYNRNFDEGIGSIEKKLLEDADRTAADMTAKCY